jgi:hypothetical protein
MELKRRLLRFHGPTRLVAEDVRYRRNYGKHLLVLSFSHFNPKRTLSGIAHRGIGTCDLATFPERRQAEAMRSERLSNLIGTTIPKFALEGARAVCGCYSTQSYRSERLSELCWRDDGRSVVRRNSLFC